MFQNKSVDVHNFAMIPRTDIPRSSFRMQRAYKSTFGGRRNGAEDFNAGLYPILCEEILPGDTWNCRMTAFARLATPLFPVMDNLYLETFFFFVPMRLLWDNWQRFMGERSPDPGSSIDFLIPQITSPANGWADASLADYFGLPVVGQIASGATVTHSALPFRAYSLIWKEWFRDQNLEDDPTIPTDDGPDDPADYDIFPRNKRHDYFTGCLPFPQKGDAVTLPLGTVAPVVSTGVAPVFQPAGAPGTHSRSMTFVNGSATNTWSASATTDGSVAFGSAPGATGLEVDLSDATAATINQIRQSFQIQRLLERDARGGTRYTEVLRAHFGVVSPDARLQRPEYLGGGRSMVQISPIAQTSATVSGEGGDTPQGNLAAIGTSLMRHHGFTQSFVEHGYVIGLVNFRCDLTYQQGLRRHWSRRTRYDYYWPVFAHLGEQAVLSKELYCQGVGGTSDGDDDLVFGYQERWAEYRYLPSEITGQFRSVSSPTLDAWHYAQFFTERPVLNSTFMVDRPPLDRNLAVPEQGAWFLFDAFFDIIAARPLPMYSVPGLIDHF